MVELTAVREALSPARLNGLSSGLQASCPGSWLTVLSTRTARAHRPGPSKDGRAPSGLAGYGVRRSSRSCSTRCSSCDVLRARDAGVDELIIELQATAQSVDHLLDTTAFLASIPVPAGV